MDIGSMEILTMDSSNPYTHDTFRILALKTRKEITNLGFELRCKHVDFLFGESYLIFHVLNTGIPQRYCSLSSRPL